jgi:DNA polymerase-3 subunit beta
MPAMLFQTTRKALHESITPASMATTAKGNYPALGYLHFEVLPGGLRVTGTDLQIRIEAMTTCDMSSAGGRFCVDAKPVMQLVNNFPDGAIEIKKLDGEWIQFKSLEPKTKLTMRLRTYDPSVYPVMDIPKAPSTEASVNCAALHTLMDATMYAVSRDEARVNLSGLHIERDGDRLVVVATDGHRMAKVDGFCAFPTFPPHVRSVDIPYRSAKLLTSFLAGADGTANVSLLPGVLTVRRGLVTMTIKLGNYVFPPWQQVIPNAYNRRCTVSKTALLTTIERALVMAPDKTHSTVFELNPRKDGAGHLQIVVDNPDQGTMRDVLADDERVRLEGESLLATYNAQYIQDALLHTQDDTIVMRSNGPLDPINISSIGAGGDLDMKTTAIVMPMRM